MPLDEGAVIEWRVKHVDRAAIAVSARFHSVMTLAQLEAVGLTRRAIAHRVERGWLTRLHRGVYLVGARNGPWPARPARCSPAATAPS